MDENIKISRVKVAEKNNSIIIPITSMKKPEISKIIIAKWQNVVNLVAKIFYVPASLIMKINKNTIEVFISSGTENNPYKKGEKAELGLGLYCETVIGKRQPLLVPNALNDQNWKNNPDIKLNMISYYGLPILWSDGEVFGTFCVLDNKENNYSELYFELMLLLKNSIELDLKILVEKEDLKKTNYEKDLLLKETFHRIKNNFNMLISLLYLEQDNNKDLEIETIIQKIETKIRTISLVHEKLSILENINKINIKDYLNELVNEILNINKNRNIKFSFNSSDILLDNNRVLSCGLIINELVTNSLKYAFVNISNPEINLKLSNYNEQYFNMEYNDNGIGLPENFKIENTNSLGCKLILLLTKQLDGKLTINTEKKPAFCLKLKWHKIFSAKQYIFVLQPKLSYKKI